MIILATNRTLALSLTFYNSATVTTSAATNITGTSVFGFLNNLISHINSLGGAQYTISYTLGIRKPLVWTITRVSGSGYVLVNGAASKLGSLIGKSINLLNLNANTVTNDFTPAHCWAMGTTRIVLEYNKFVATHTITESGVVTIRRSSSVQNSNRFSSSLRRIVDFSEIYLTGKEFLVQYSPDDTWRAFEGVWSEWEHGLRYYTATADLVTGTYRLVYPTKHHEDIMDVVDNIHTKAPLVVRLRFEAIIKEA